jgi:tetratricopeptide (TPR) repeat protein
VAIAVVVIVALVWAFAPRGTAPALPTIESLGAVAPEVAAAAQDALNSLAQNRRDAQRWGRFGMICEANGLVDAARDAYASATALDRTDAKWWYRLAAVESRLGRDSDAIDAVRRSIEANGMYAPSHRRLGFWLLDHDDTDAAEREFRRAGELDPNDVSAPLGLARVSLQRGQDQAAVDLLERTLAHNPGDRYAMQLLGTAYSRLGRREEAEFALAVGAAGEPAWVDPWTDEMLQYRRGFAVRLKDATQYFVAGRMAEAIALLQQLRTEKPDDVALLNHLGEVYVAAGRLGEGIAMLEQVVARDPERFEAHVNLASGYLKQNDLVRARAAVDRAIAINPTLGRAHEARGLILWRAGDEAGALDAFRTAFRWDPRNVRSLVWAGMVQINRHAADDARERFAHAARLDPTRVEAWVGVANASMALRDWAGADAALQRAARLNPESPDVKRSAEHLRSIRR